MFLTNAPIIFVAYWSCSLGASDEYCSATAKTVEEACKLVETGFEEYVCVFNGVKIFRKRK